MDCSMPGFPVLYHLLECAQTYVHWIGDAIQPSQPLSSPSPAFNLSQYQGFSSESPLPIRWPKYWSFIFSISLPNEYSELISFRIDRFDLLAVQGLSRVFSSTTVQKYQFFTSGGQSTGASSSASVFPVNIQSWFPLGLTGLISLLFTRFSKLLIIFGNLHVKLT